MSTFNFGQTADLGTKGGSELLTGEGESGLFAPGELDMDIDFSKGGDDDPATPPAQEPKPKVEPKPVKKAEGSEPAKAEIKEIPKELLKSSIEDDLDDDDPDGNEEGDPGDPDPGEEGGNEDDPNYNPYEGYAEDMFAAGIFTPLEGDEDLDFTDETVLQARFNKQLEFGANKMLNSFLSKYGPKQREAFNAIFLQGNDPEKYYQKSARIENLEKVNLEDATVQERLVKSYLGRLGWSEEDIAERVEKIKTYDDLERESKIAHKHLLKAEQDELAADAAENQARVAREQQMNQMYVSGVQQTLTEALSKKELGGIPVNKATADRVYNLMAVKQWNVGGKEMTTFERILEDLKDPRNVEIAMKVALLYDNKFDFTPIKKKAVSEETNTLFNSIKRTQKTQRRGRPGKVSGDNWSI